MTNEEFSKHITDLQNKRLKEALKKEEELNEKTEGCNDIDMFYKKSILVEIVEKLPICLYATIFIMCFVMFFKFFYVFMTTPLTLH